MTSSFWSVKLCIILFQFNLTMASYRLSRKCKVLTTLDSLGRSRSWMFPSGPSLRTIASHWWEQKGCMKERHRLGWRSSRKKMGKEARWGCKIFPFANLVPFICESNSRNDGGTLGPCHTKSEYSPGIMHENRGGVWLNNHFDAHYLFMIRCDDGGGPTHSCTLCWPTSQGRCATMCDGWDRSVLSELG